MDVIDSQAGALTNAEVYQLVKELRDSELKRPKASRAKNLSTVLYEVHKYLKPTVASTQADVDVKKLVADLGPFGLTSAEILQVINLRPANATEVQLLVEESEERLKTEEQVEAVVNLVVDSLPSRPMSSTDEAQT